MEKLKSLQTPLVIIVLVVVAGFLTVVWPSISGGFASGGGSGNVDVSEPLTSSTVNLDLDGMFYTIAGDYLFQVPAFQNLDDTAYNGLAVLGILAAVVIGGVVVVGLLIMLLVRAGDRSTEALKESEDYKNAITEMENAEKAYIKTNMQQNPPKEKPSGLMPRWSVISTSLLFGVLAYWFGVVVGAEVSPELEGTFGSIFGVIALGVSFYSFRTSNIYTVDATDYNRTPRGTLWVILSGAIIVGLGMGFMFAVINGRDPFPFLDAAWWQENIIGPLTS
ncbi:MAG: hypothetical protein KDE51_15370 [Anaerolineales bacterium]|nr:hypothetical protein [Anaerolineales bacterium]